MAENRLITGKDAIREALIEEMRRDPSVFLLGEDLEQATFGVTDGIIDEFGPERVRNTPISENAIIGAAIGAALTGMRPVAEIMFADFLMDAMDPIVNTMAKIRFMTGGQAKVPMVIRTPSGAGLSAGAQHSQSPEAIFLHIPGIRIAVPSTPYDMKGLLKTAIRSDDPVLFFEHKMLYYEGGEVPDGDYTIPFGKADIKRKGKDVTIVAVLAMVKKALMAADMLAAEGIDVEVVDPMTLNPLDMDTIINSVKKTKRLITVEEGAKTGGIGAEISARVAEEALDYLDAPIKRLGGVDCPIPFSPVLEEQMYPTEDGIVTAVKQMLG
ncbi:MAG: alpha-ketoacid dehydrogenase subunit beta [bacterium]